MRRHREPRHLVGGLAAVLLHLLAQQRPNAERFPQDAGRRQNAIRLDRLEVIDAHLRRKLPRRQIDPISVGHT
jgi:hypothetical protein